MFGHTFSFKRMGRYVLTFYWYCTSSKLRAFGALGGLGPWGVTLFVQPCSTTHTHTNSHTHSAKYQSQKVTSSCQKEAHWLYLAYQSHMQSLKTSATSVTGHKLALC